MVTTPSNQFFNRGEIGAIRELIDLGKQDHIRLIITKSDRMEEDEEDGKIVKLFFNKSEDVRKMQEEDGLGRLSNHKEGIPGFRLEEPIISLSVEAAKRGLQTNDKDGLFSKSGLIDFYDSMARITRNKASSLKGVAPYRTLVGLIDSILGASSSSSCSLEQLREDLRRIEELVDSKKTDLEDMSTVLSSKVGFLIAHRVNTNTANVNASNSNSVFSSLREEVHGEIQSVVKEEFGRFLDDFDTMFSAIAPDLDLVVTEHRETTTKTVDTRGGFQKFINKVSFGFFCNDGVYEREVTISISDNSAQVVSENSKILQSHYEELLKEQISLVNDELIGPCRELAKKLGVFVRELEESLQGIRRELQGRSSL